ncbi:unknown [Clostridium sp. CAG:169]|nr:unknown [Clostridium sp. CAG:169]
MIILISVGYLAVIVHRQNFALTYDDRLGFLSLSIKVLVACLIPILTFAWGELPRFIPFVILLFICTLILTQALRHDPSVYLQRRYRTAVLLCSALLALLVVLFSSSWFINLLLQLPYLFYRWVIAPIIMLVALVVGGALMLLFSPLQDKIRSFLSQIYDQFVGRLNAPLQELPENMEAEAPFQLLDYLSPLFTLAISIAGLILLVRLIKRNRHRFQPSNAKETRTTVSGSRYFEAAAPADLFPPSEPRKAVRYYYRCFLRTCQKMGVFFPSSADSQTIEQQSQKFFRPESLGQLRQVRRVYIKARYSDDPVQEQDVQQIKSAYEYLKDEQEEMDKR